MAAIVSKQKSEPKNNIEELRSLLTNNITALSRDDRALIYAMSWCNTEKSNKDHYTVDELIDVARNFSLFLK